MLKKLLKKLNRSLRTLIDDEGCFPLDIEPYRPMSATKIMDISIENFESRAPKFIPLMCLMLRLILKYISRITSYLHVR